MTRRGHRSLSSDAGAPAPARRGKHRTVRGRVLTRSGAPARGALITWSPGVDLALEVDADGRFELTQAPRGKFRLSATSGGERGAAELAAGGDLDDVILCIGDER